MVSAERYREEGRGARHYRLVIKEGLQEMTVALLSWWAGREKRRI